MNWTQLSPQRLYNLASNILNHTATRQEIAMVNGSGLIEWDIDGPTPTQKYIDLMDRFEPLPEYLVVK